jgi:hypothetical protein
LVIDFDPGTTTRAETGEVAKGASHGLSTDVVTVEKPTRAAAGALPVELARTEVSSA